MGSGAAWSTSDGYYTIYKDGANLFNAGGFANGASDLSLTISHLNSPSTTSSVTYTLYIKTGGSGTVYFHPASNGTSNLILLEIGA